MYSHLCYRIVMVPPNARATNFFHEIARLRDFEHIRGCEILYNPYREISLDTIKNAKIVRSLEVLVMDVQDNTVLEGGATSSSEDSSVVAYEDDEVTSSSQAVTRGGS